MQLPTKKKSSKKAIILVAVIVIGLVGAGIYIWLTDKSSKQDNTSTQKTSQESNRTADTKDSKATATSDKSTAESDSDSTTQSSTTQHEKEKNITPEYEGEDANQAQDITGTINYSAISEGSLLIRTTINQLLDSGTCQLTLTNGSKTITRTSGIAKNPSSSTCKGFDIPTSELNSGTWNITIKINSASRAGTLTGSAKI